LPCLVLGLDVDDAVGIDIEGHLDLRHAARDGGIPRIELPSSLLSAPSPLALEHAMVTAVWPSSAVEKVWLFWSVWWCCGR